MSLDNQTAEKLTEAFNNLSDSLDAFINVYPNGITLSQLTHEKLDKLNSNLENFNQKNI